MTIPSKPYRQTDHTDHTDIRQVAYLAAVAKPSGSLVRNAYLYRTQISARVQYTEILSASSMLAIGTAQVLCHTYSALSTRLLHCYNTTTALGSVETAKTVDTHPDGADVQRECSTCACWVEAGSSVGLLGLRGL